MSLLRNLPDGLRSLFRKERVEGELDEELNGFLEMATEEKMKQGMSRKDAVKSEAVFRELAAVIVAGCVAGNANDVATNRIPSAISANTLRSIRDDPLSRTSRT